MTTPVMIPINVIFSFDEYEQDWADIELPVTLSEDEVLNELFALYVPDELEKLASLYKISTCQSSVDGQTIEHLVARNGKYYFNPEENDDDDVRALRAKLDEFVRTHQAATPAKPGRKANPPRAQAAKTKAAKTAGKAKATKTAGKAKKARPATKAKVTKAKVTKAKATKAKVTKAKVTKAKVTKTKTARVARKTKAATRGTR